ncbi:MAG: 2-oxo acid dehydrogenase subunit E2, partial [Erysipelotrichaceae bacterium]|nr:2-oxo acid dehydrogenase subunit E2 [Erysipelotrichaceae bacterium]
MRKRRDAVLAKVDAFHNFSAFLMGDRTEREVHIYKEIDVTDLLEYLKEKNEGVEKDEQLKLFHAICTAVARTIKMRPMLNRFLKDNLYWDRKEITFSFVAKKRFTDHAEESLMMMKADDNSNLETIGRKIIGEVHEARTGEKPAGADDVLETLQKLPHFLNKIVMAVLNLMDRKGWLPASLTDVDPNHTTVLLTNLGSIGCDAVYHHLSEFGTNSIMIAIGVIYNKEVIHEDGTREIRKFVKLGCTLDELIADGFYFAKSLKIVDYLMANPKELEVRLGDPINYDCN